MNDYPNEPEKQKLVRRGQRWVPEWLSERQIGELNHFFDHGFRWRDFTTRDQIREKIREVKSAFEEALQLADDDPEQFLLEWEKASGFDARVYGCVRDTQLHGEWHSGWPYEGKPHIFRKVQGRGNPDFQRKPVSPEKAVQTVRDLLNENGAAAYPAQGHGPPTKLLEEAGEQLGMHRSTVRSRLEQAEETLDFTACHIRVKQ
jgi:hypothetical protein